MFIQFPYDVTSVVTINVNKIISIYPFTKENDTGKTIIVCSRPIFHTQEHSVHVDTAYEQVLDAIANATSEPVVNLTRQV